MWGTFEEFKVLSCVNTGNIDGSGVIDAFEDTADILLHILNEIFVITIKYTLNFKPIKSIFIKYQFYFTRDIKEFFGDRFKD